MYTLFHDASESEKTESTRKGPSHDYNLVHSEERYDVREDHVNDAWTIHTETLEGEDARVAQEDPVSFAKNRVGGTFQEDRSCYSEDRVEFIGRGGIPCGALVFER